MATPIVENDPSTSCFDQGSKFVFIGTGRQAILWVKPWSDKASARVTDASTVSLATATPLSPTEAALVMTGTKAGYTELIITCDSGRPAKWRVLVGDPVAISIACHLVRGRDASTSSTTLTVSDAIAEANTLLDPANVFLNAANYPTDTLVLNDLEGPALVRGSFNPVQKLRTARQTHLLVSNRARGADINAFFLASLELRKASKWDLRGLAFPGRNIVLVDDQPTAALIGKTLAHEVTHARGSAHALRSTYPSALMVGDASGKELRLRDVLNLRKESLPYSDPPIMATL
jgi:hypothetical protein